MRHQSRSITSLMAEDEPDDRLQDEDAFRASGLGNNLYFIQGGEVLLQVLRQQGMYAAPESKPRLDLIQLNMNMLHKDGWEALTKLKAAPDLRCIPVFVATISQVEEDVLRTYDLGGSGFITKPVTFEGLVEVVELPNGGRLKASVVTIPPGVLRVNPFGNESCAGNESQN
jgi:CheY-like chemotaxis protein